MMQHHHERPTTIPLLHGRRIAHTGGQPVTVEEIRFIHLGGSSGGTISFP
jgi:hypothetical protein